MLSTDFLKSTLRLAVGAGVMGFATGNAQAAFSDYYRNPGPGEGGAFANWQVSGEYEWKAPWVWSHTNEDGSYVEDDVLRTFVFVSNGIPYVSTAVSNIYDLYVNSPTTVTVREGGSLAVMRDTVLVGVSSGPANLVITGGGSAFSTKNFWLEDAGVTVRDGGAFSATELFSMNTGAVLNIGAAKTEAAGGAGVFSVATIVSSGSGTDWVQFNHNEADYTFASAFSGSAAIEHNAAGVTRLTGSLGSAMREITVNAGTLHVDDVPGLGAATIRLNATGMLTYAGTAAVFGNLVGDGQLTLGTGRSLTVGANNADALFSGTLSGNGTLIKNGTGVWTITGDSDYSGTVQVNAGTLQLGDATAGAGGSLAGNIESNAALVFSHGADFTYAGRISGGGAITKRGAATLTLTGQHEHTGQVFIDAGTLALASTGSFSGNTLEVAREATLRLNDTAMLGNTNVFNQGTFLLENNTALSGTEVINAHIFHASHDATAGTAHIVNQGQLTFQDNADAGSATITNFGTASFRGAAQASGATIVNSLGAEIFLDALTAEALGVGSLSGIGTVYLGDKKLMLGALGGNDTFAGLFTGNGVLEKVGGGVLTLTGSNTHAGGTILSQGVVAVTLGDNLGVGPVSFNGGTLQINATTTLAHDATIRTLGIGIVSVGLGHVANWGGNFSGDGLLLKDGAGTLILSGDNRSAAGLVVRGGVLAVSSAENLAGENVIFDGGTLRFSDSFSASHLAGFESGKTGIFSTDAETVVQWNGAIVGTGILQKTGAGTLVLNANNIYTEGTVLREGALLIGHDSALGNGVVRLEGGTFGVTGARTLSNAVVLADDSTIEGGDTLVFSGGWTLERNRDLVVNNTSGTTISGVVSQSGGARVLAKYGTGELVLTNANTYTGGTLIAEGTVRIGNTTGSVFGSGAVTLAAGATLAGNGSFSGALQVNGTFAPGNSVGHIESGSVVFSETGVWLWEINDATGAAGVTAGGWDLSTITGTLTFFDGARIEITSLGLDNLSGLAVNFDRVQNYAWKIAATTSGIIGWELATLRLDNFANDFDGTFALSVSGNDLYLNYTAVPEPSTYALLGGVVLMGLALRRRRR